MLYVATAVHNRYQITKRYMESLKRQTLSDFRVILVDDGCTDGTGEMVRGFFPQAIIIRGDGNLWWGGALNMIYRRLAFDSGAANSDGLLICNDDSRIPDDFLEKGARLLAENPHSLVTGCGFSMHTGVQLDGAVRYDYRMSMDTVLAGSSEGNCASTRQLFLTVGAMREIGGFHPRLLPHYGSDYEYTLRASRKGYMSKCFEELRYEFDDKTTGFDSKKDKLTLKKVFTKRSMANPVYRINLILLVTPARYLPGALWQQFKRYRGKVTSK